MQLKDKILKDIDNLEPELLPMVYDYIKTLKKSSSSSGKGQGSSISHKKVQELLSSSESSWSDDITQEREERI